MIAWKLVTKFDEQRHLFFEKIDTDYIVETYLCICGHTEFIVKYPEQETNYICEECENTKFYDANSAWRNIEHFLYRTRGLKLSYGYDIKESNESIIVNYVVEIPDAINFLSRKVLFSKKPVYSLILTSDGDLKEDYLLNFEKLFSLEMHKNLTTYINDYGCFSVPDSGEKNLTLTMALFFLKNKHLRDFDFYYWNKIEEFKSKNINIDSALETIANYPKAKSVRKAYYRHYLRQLYDNGCFYSSFLEVFCHNIKDTNILVKLLNLVFDYSLYKNIDRERFSLLLNFLTKHYSDKQILKLFNSSELQDNEYILKDTLSEFNYSKDVIENKFRKVACKIQLLHDEFVRCTKEERYKYMQSQLLNYSKEDMKPCIEVNTYQVKLPKSGKELFDWADELHNCMAGYFDTIKNSGTIIYTFFQKDALVFAVEICDRETIQASRKYNADLTVQDNEVLTKWFQLFFSKDKQRIEHVA